MSSHAPNSARVIPLRPVPAAKEPLWRDVVGDVLRRERLAQQRTLKDVADAARISMPYLSELERGRKEASSEVLAAAARALGLGLADLLALAQVEIIRLTGAGARPGRTGAAAPQARLNSHQGEARLRLAA
ncbi:helix-turn-helix domain-containing protein [Streptomyces botrytidirepellens]|uniref:XRE family transcriptional regulator n=1 Tax=Streptomyces botrytidirepellens TaxID=2486417 RepID=A0A3M8TGT5_9ACTN|nr:helix-turn-helix transcriptional regulator [Streptomyces botrytidirepellens]RNF92761.1 XRE family transcriptional regulator [Streptomyces botrytidirepellens]